MYATCEKEPRQSKSIQYIHSTKCTGQIQTHILQSSSAASTQCVGIPIVQGSSLFLVQALSSNVLFGLTLKQTRDILALGNPSYTMSEGTLSIH